MDKDKDKDKDKEIDTTCILNYCLCFLKQMAKRFVNSLVVQKQMTFCMKITTLNCRLATEFSYRFYSQVIVVDFAANFPLKNATKPEPLPDTNDLVHLTWVQI